MIDNKVRSIVASLSNARGEDFFNTIVLALSQAIDADHTYVAKLSDDYTIATSIAYAQTGGIVENFSYPLKDTPCADVCGDGACFLNGDVQHLYPDDQLLVDMNVNSYVGAPLRDSQGKVQGIIIALYCDTIHRPQDIESLFLLFSGLISGEMERRDNQRRLNIHQTMIDSLDEAVLLTNEQIEIIYANPAFSTISGYSEEEALGKNPGHLLGSGLHDTAFYQAMWTDLSQKGVWSGELLNRKKSGETYTEWAMFHRFIEPDSGDTHYLAIFHDISELKSAREIADIREHYDLLTDLPNRRLLLDRIKQQLMIAERQQNLSALICISIDDFRDINSSLGHHIGDKLLQRIAKRLSANTRKSDTIARISGDEFALLIPVLSKVSTLESSAQQILDSIRTPFCIDDHVIEITASAGISVYPNDANSSLDLLSKADQATRFAKSRGKNTYQFFTRELQTRSDNRLYLKNALSKALHGRTLDVYYQPIINLSNGRIEKCEALVRWQHQGQFVSPTEFIPIAEEFNMANELGMEVLKRACDQALSLKQQGRNVTIAVNRSIAEFKESENASLNWLDYLHERGVACADISFEITESLLAPENSKLSTHLQHLQQAKCAIALDDFGTGYSSLSYLRAFPIDYLKIDRSFIQDMEDDEDAMTLVATIIAMAKALKMKTIAEGVETTEQLNTLIKLECDFVQGYLISRPLPAPEFDRFLVDFDDQHYSALLS